MGGQEVGLVLAAMVAASQLEAEGYVLPGLRGEGAFLVSARRVSNKTRFVAVLSEAGSGLVVEADMPEPWAAQSNATTPVTLERLHPVGPAMLPRYRVHGLSAWSSVVLVPPLLRYVSIKAASALTSWLSLTAACL